MPRVLVMSNRTVPASERAGYLQALGQRRQGAATVKANFWVFEEINSHGNFLEFVEAADETALATAVAATSSGGVRTTNAPPLWREVTET